jgi:type VI secretion system protein ImpK
VSSDPFESGGERTVFMPVPGGRPGPPTRSVAIDTTEVGDRSTVASGLNPILVAANPLLDVVPQLRMSPTHPNPAGLRESLARGIREFEARTKAAGIPHDKVIAARYALCTLIDETASGTPWGASGAWAQRGLLVLFHNETSGGEKFFQLLGRLAEDPHANLDILEFMYVCLQLGLEGRYRVMEGGQRALEMVRQRLFELIRKQRGEYERELSPSWRGVPAARSTKLGWLPLWIVAAVTALLLAVTYFGFRLSLSPISDRVASDIAGVRATRLASRPAPPKSAAVAPLQQRLAPLLVDEIQRGQLAVDDRPDRSVVTILGDGLFRPGEVAVRPEYQGLLLRVADALSGLPGAIDVIGHSDNAPIRTLRFPSNWELSTARAESVTKLFATRVPGQRIRAEGRADTDPVESNNTPEGRARNRRVDVTLHVAERSGQRVANPLPERVPKTVPQRAPERAPEPAPVELPPRQR